MAITESGYPKKGEVIHAGDVASHFTDVSTPTSSSGNIKTVYLTRRNEKDADKAEVINWCVNTLETSTTNTWPTCVSAKAARAKLAEKASAQHTHPASQFTEFQNWSIQDNSSDGRLVFSST